MILDYQELVIEIDMLQGNINRMCITDSIYELEKMNAYVNIRQEEIYNYNVLRIKNIKKEV